MPFGNVLLYLPFGKLYLLGDKSLMSPGVTKAEPGLNHAGFIVANRLILFKSPCRLQCTERLSCT